MNLEKMTDDQLRSLHKDIKAEAARRRGDLLAKASALWEMAEHDPFRNPSVGEGRGKRVGLEAYRQCAAEGLNMYQTAKRLGVTGHAVAEMRDRHGIEFVPGARGKRK